jgi:hypothetical protein
MLKQSSVPGPQSSIPCHPSSCVLLTMALLLGVSGCVERNLTVNTTPEGAKIRLNDEYIGESPVNVSFEWYGDYTVEISKPGYQTLRTHKMLKGPWYDDFPFDLLAQVYPKRIIDEYQWHFELSPPNLPNREELISETKQMGEQLEQELGEE